MGTGRRKEAVVRVRLIPGTGQVVLNGRPIEDYFPARSHRLMITSPFRVLGREKECDVIARLDGGGGAAQAGALRHGIARARAAPDSDRRAARTKEWFLTSDPSGT